MGLKAVILCGSRPRFNRAHQRRTARNPFRAGIVNDIAAPSARSQADDRVHVTLVRHGETYQNRNEVVQGQHPAYGRLTPEGIRQATLLGKRLARRPFDAVYCSPLERAVLTMSLILVPRDGERTLPLVFAEALREINLGALEGGPRSAWKAAVQGQDPAAFRVPGGESWLDVQARVTHYFRETILSAGHRQVLIVAHGGVNRGLLASLTGISMADAWRGTASGCPQDNTCVNELILDRDGTLLEAVVNDTCHLEGHFAHAAAGQRWHVAERRWELLGEPPAGTRPADFDPYG